MGSNYHSIVLVSAMCLVKIIIFTFLYPANKSKIRNVSKFSFALCNQNDDDYTWMLWSVTFPKQFKMQRREKPLFQQIRKKEVLKVMEAIALHETRLREFPDNSREENIYLFSNIKTSKKTQEFSTTPLPNAVMVNLWHAYQRWHVTTFGGTHQPSPTPDKNGVCVTHFFILVIIWCLFI